MTAEASVRAAGNVRRGKTAEQAVARYLRDFWPGAVRAVRTASAAAPDPGDIAGVPGVVISVKDTASERWPTWWSELDAMLAGDPGALGFIVQKNRGHAWPADWWAHARLVDVVSLHGVRFGEPHPADRAQVRLRLGDLVALLVGAGYAR